MFQKQLLKKQVAAARGETPQTLRALGPSDVGKGDVIFYEEIPDGGVTADMLKPGDGRIHHAEICTQSGQGQQLAAMITSQVNIQENRERGFEARQHTRTTTLQHKASDRLLVMRCNNANLAQKAADYAIRWERLKIPFNRRGTMPNPKQWKVEELRRQFDATGRFRAIRYAARRSAEILEPTDDPRPTSGMFCSHFVVACYQVAALEQFVNPAGAKVPVHDKKGRCDWERIDPRYRTNAPAYEHYRRTDDSNESRGDGSAGIMFWRFDVAGDIGTFNWAKYLTTGMMVDSKKVMPHPLFACLHADREGWRVEGALKPAGGN